MAHDLRRRRPPDKAEIDRRTAPLMPRFRIDTGLGAQDGEIRSAAGN